MYVATPVRPGLYTRLPLLSHSRCAGHGADIRRDRSMCVELDSVQIIPDQMSDAIAALQVERSLSVCWRFRQLGVTSRGLPVWSKASPRQASTFEVTLHVSCMHTAAVTDTAGLATDPGASPLSRQPVRGSRRTAKVNIPVVPPVLPSLASSKHFLNLTNGLEAVPLLEELHLSYSFVRIQSTACEQQRFDALLADLDSSFLLHLALGHCCFVWDFASRSKKRGIPRAVWYGLEFITYILRRVWFQRCTEAWLRRQNVTSVFEQHLNGLEGPTIAKLRYYMRYIPPGVTDVQLYGVSQATIHDSDPRFYRDIALLHLQPCPASEAADMETVGQSQATTKVQHPVPAEGVMKVEDVLQPYGYKLFYGGVYHKQDYRAM